MIHSSDALQSVLIIPRRVPVNICSSDGRSEILLIDFAT
jgi:hypothetical protein